MAGFQGNIHLSNIRFFTNKSFLRGMACLYSRKICKVASSEQQLWKLGHISQYSGSPTLKVTLENVLSGTNKSRVQSQLLTVRPTRRFPWKKGRDLSHAGVLVPLCTVNGCPSVLFTLRSNELAKHRGEVSFPGGKMDQSDPNVIHTALREAEEELGLDQNSIDIWGELQAVPSRDFKMAVTPVLANCGEVNIDDLDISHGEVASVFTRTIESLCDPDNTSFTRFRSRMGYTLPVFLGGELRIWGLTAIMLHQTLTVLAPELYTFKIKHNA